MSVVLALEHWINDGLMAIFFLLIGLELERELYNGELAQVKNALLPIFAAIGGMAVPALIHFSVNAGTSTQAGIGIPMATDIAFALGVLAILGNHIPASLKVFVVAFAIIDDLGAIVVIAAFYTTQLSVWYLAGAAGSLGPVVCAESSLPCHVPCSLFAWRRIDVVSHASVRRSRDDCRCSACLCNPILCQRRRRRVTLTQTRTFLTQTGCVHHLADFRTGKYGHLCGHGLDTSGDQYEQRRHYGWVNSWQTFGGDITVFSAVASGLCRLPPELNWRHISGAGILGGIGFTMSIFIANLAFVGNAETTNASKMAILFASLIAGTIGFLWLKLFVRPETTDSKMILRDTSLKLPSEEKS